MLKKGNRGSEVQDLQFDLILLGYLKLGQDDGIFGKDTDKAVRTFQKNRGLQVDGIVGGSTERELDFCLGFVNDKELYKLENTQIPHHFEGCKLKSYRCPASVLTIGWGSTGDHVYEGQAITQQQADDLFVKDMQRFVDNLNKVVVVDLTQNQVDSLLSFMYNIGCGNFNSSTLLKKLNKGDYEGASEQFLRWNKGDGKVLTGLTRRRKAEQHYFNTGQIDFFV